MKRGLLTIALLSAFPGPAIAAPLQPTGKWVLNFDEARCLASRNYGSEEKPLYLFLKPAPVGGQVQLIVGRKGIGGYYAEQGEAALATDKGDAIKSTHLSWLDRSSKLRLTAVMLTTAQFDKVRGASWIDLKTEHEVREQFALANLTPMLSLMDQCLADLQKYWNVTALDADRGSAAPRMVNPLARLFNTSDYPNTSIRKGESGTVGLIALVDEKGAIRDCTVSQTSGMAALDAQSCAVVTERGKFKPAIDAKGAPMKSWVSARIRWEMP